MSIVIPFLEINSNQGRIGRLVWSNNKQAPKGFCFLSGDDREFDPNTWFQLVTEWIDALIDFSRQNNCIAYGKCNDINFQASPLSTTEELYSFYQVELKRAYEEYETSAEYKYYQQQAVKAKAEQQAKFNAMVQASPQVLTLKNLEAWQQFVAKNCDDPYGRGVLTFAEYWARFMEGQIAAGHQLSDVAASCSDLADTDGITGFMYGCAVSILSSTWVYGENLRRWHNKKTQINGEGDRANEDGGVLNPALLSVSL
jgi:hypothetical protein